MNAPGATRQPHAAQAGQARRALAALCAALALAGGGALLGTYLPAQPFANSAAVSPAPPRRAAHASPALPRGTVDVNAADAQALLALPGVGPALAAAIVAEREAHGPFRYPEDLLAVPGIGDKRLAAIRELLAFGP